MPDRTAHYTPGHPQLQSETLSQTKDANQTNKQDLHWTMNTVCSVYDILHDKAQLLQDHLPCCGQAIPRRPLVSQAWVRIKMDGEETPNM